jgi:hypothetical protein
MRIACPTQRHSVSTFACCGHFISPIDAALDSEGCQLLIGSHDEAVAVASGWASSQNIMHSFSMRNTKPHDQSALLNFSGEHGGMFYVVGETFWPV